jgi:hypothetical protein
LNRWCEEVSSRPYAPKQWAGERVQHVEAKLSTALDEAARQLAAAVERADAADRRVALELERERHARSKAERTAETLASRIEAMRKEGGAAAAAAQRELDAARDRESSMKVQLVAATAELAQERERSAELRQAAAASAADASAARNQAAALQQSLGRLTAMLEPGLRRGATQRRKRTADGQAA